MTQTLQPGGSLIISRDKVGMKPVVAIVVVCGMCMMFSCVVGGGYVILNKPQAQGDTLMTEDQLKALMEASDDSKNQIHTSNVSGLRMGFDSQTLIGTRNLSGSECQALCSVTGACQGFQIYGTNGCDLLANVQSTYGFLDQNYNMFNMGTVEQMKRFGVSKPGKISSTKALTQVTTPSAPPRPPLSAVTTDAGCASECMMSSQCTAISVSPASGCMITSGDPNDMTGDISGHSYFLQDVVANRDWIWKAPAPSPS